MGIVVDNVFRCISWSCDAKSIFLVEIRDVIDIDITGILQRREDDARTGNYIGQLIVHTEIRVNLIFVVR